MTLLPGRFDYAPIIDRPVIKWPDNARVAFWVAPNMEFFEYLPQNRPTQPDVPHYSRMDYGNRVGFWRMLDVLNKHKCAPAAVSISSSWTTSPRSRMP